MERWGDGAMGRWSDGAMERWGDGTMERWSDGAMGRWFNIKGLINLRKTFTDCKLTMSWMKVDSRSRSYNYFS